MGGRRAGERAWHGEDNRQANDLKKKLSRKPCESCRGHSGRTYVYRCLGAHRNQRNFLSQEYPQRLSQVISRVARIPHRRRRRELISNRTEGYLAAISEY